MNTITIEVDKRSDEWTKLRLFVHSLGLTMSENEPDVQVRAGWAEAAKRMHECGDDHLLIDDVFDDEIFEPWQ
jgi:antitoxin MazE